MKTKLFATKPLIIGVYMLLKCVDVELKIVKSPKNMLIISPIKPKAQVSECSKKSVSDIFFLIFIFSSH